MSNDTAYATQASAPAADPEFRVFDFASWTRLFWRRRFTILGFTLAGALIAAAAAFLIHPAYDSTVRLMPPSRKDSSLLVLSAARNEGDLYLGLVGSRTVADDVIEHQHLADYFHTSSPSALRRDLANMAKISVDKDQFVTVTVRAREPETALRIAAEFPEALSRLNHTVALSQAAHRWEFYAGPLEQEKNKLADAEDQLKRAQQKTGMVQPAAQVQLGLSAIAALKQQITARQEQLAGLAPSSTEQNPQVIQLRSQIASLSGQLHRLEAQNGGAGSSGTSAAMPELTLEIQRLTREVSFHENLLQILSRQYENARVDESYSAPVELVDRAVLADEKSWPPRRLFGEIGLLAGWCLGFLFVWLRALELPRRFRGLIGTP